MAYNTRYVPLGELDKLDEDFLFLLGLTQSFSHRLEDTPEHSRRCNAWLEKLCGDAVQGLEKKRIRNTYLSQLILCMQAAELHGVFKDPPPAGDLPDVFAKKEKVAEPPWLRDLSSVDATQTTATGIPGRTYLATKQFPKGGACAYLAVANGTKPKDWTFMQGGKPDFGHESMEKRFPENKGRDSDMENFMQRFICTPHDYKAMVAASIASELHGDVAPGQIQAVDDALLQYKNYLADNDPMKIVDMMDLGDHEQRQFLLKGLLQNLFVLDARQRYDAPKCTYR